MWLTVCNFFIHMTVIFSWFVLIVWIHIFDINVVTNYVLWTTELHIPHTKATKALKLFETRGFVVIVIILFFAKNTFKHVNCNLIMTKCEVDYQFPFCILHPQKCITKARVFLVDGKGLRPKLMLFLRISAMRY